MSQPTNIPWYQVSGADALDGFNSSLAALPESLHPRLLEDPPRPLLDWLQPKLDPPFMFRLILALSLLFCIPALADPDQKAPEVS